ncbi:hypothetical protein HDU97_002436 [Phlyctochytrium planicorne]|nr:hypothetical protein HDU97_002436 [Phlyctochytrium planicorne]
MASELGWPSKHTATGGVSLPPILHLKFDQATHQDHLHRLQAQQSKWQNQEKRKRPGVSQLVTGNSQPKRQFIQKRRVSHAGLGSLAAGLHDMPLQGLPPPMSKSLPAIPKVSTPPVQQLAEPPSWSRRNTLARPGQLTLAQSLSSASFYEEMVETAPWSFSNRPGVEKNRFPRNYIPPSYLIPALANGEAERRFLMGLTPLCVDMEERSKGTMSRVLGKVRGEASKKFPENTADVQITRGELGPWTQQGRGETRARSRVVTSKDPIKRSQEDYEGAPEVWTEGNRNKVKIVPVYGKPPPTSIKKDCERIGCAAKDIGVSTGTQGGVDEDTYYYDDQLYYQSTNPEDTVVTLNELRRATIRAERVHHILVGTPSEYIHSLPKQEEDHPDLLSWLWGGPRPPTSHFHPSKNPLTSLDRVPPVMGEPNYGDLKTKRLSTPLETTLPMLRLGESWAKIKNLPAEGVNKGVYTLIDRGFIPPATDLTNLLRPLKYLATQKAVLHYNDDFDGSSVRQNGKRIVHREVPAVYEADPWNFTVHTEVATPGPDYKLGRHRPREERNWKAKEWFSEKKKLLKRLQWQDMGVNEDSQVHHYKKVQEDNPFPTAARKSAPCPPPSVAETAAEQEARLNSEGWIIIIRFGEISVSSPGYQDFKARSCGVWTTVDYLLKKIAKVMKQYSIPWAEIKCARLRDLAFQIPTPFQTIPTATLHSLISNLDVVKPLLQQPGRRYLSDPNPRLTAAIRIQVNWRAYNERKVFDHHMQCRIAAMAFIRAWRFKMRRRALAAAIRARFEMVHMKRYHRLIAYLRREWVEIEAQKRFLVFLAPRMYEEDDFDLVVGRLTVLRDPLISCVLILPDCSEDKEQYLKQKLEIAFPGNNPMDGKKRLHLIVPECARNFLPLGNIARMVLVSSRSLARIKQLIKDRTSILICDSAGEPEVTLSSMLDIPMLGPLPTSYRRINTRDKARILMKEAGLDVAPAVRATGQERDTCMYFAQCCLLYPDVPRWNLYENRGFGRIDFSRQDDKPDAWIESQHIQISTSARTRGARPSISAFQPVRPQSNSSTGVNSFQLTLLPFVPEALQSKPRTKPLGLRKAIQRLTNLQRSLKAHLQTRDGADYNVFLARWCRNTHFLESAPLWVKERDSKGPDGGLIQASPVVDGSKMRRIEIGFLVDPRGKWSIIGSSESILAENFLEAAVILPQQSCDKSLLTESIKKVAWTCAGKGIYGYMTLQLVTWEEEATVISFKLFFADE